MYEMLELDRGRGGRGGRSGLCLLEQVLEQDVLRCLQAPSRRARGRSPRARTSGHE